MELRTITLIILSAVVTHFSHGVSGLGYSYSPYYGGLGGYYGGGYGNLGYSGLGYGSGCGSSYGGLGCGYKTCSPYPYNYGATCGAACLTPCCLKAKLLKSCLALKKPCLLPKPKPLPCLSCLHKPCLPCLSKPCLPCLGLQKPCLPCLGLQRPCLGYQKPCLGLHQPASACIKTDACFKYPACGPCPYASFQPKCLKHKATLALCSA